MVRVTTVSRSPSVAACQRRMSLVSDIQKGGEEEEKEEKEGKEVNFG